MNTAHSLHWPIIIPQHTVKLVAKRESFMHLGIRSINAILLNAKPCGKSQALKIDHRYFMANPSFMHQVFNT
jgi:hypothetical protein